MKAPDKHIIDRTLNNTATPEEARQVIRWFSTPEGTKYLSSLMDEDAEKIQPGSEELYAERSIPSDEMYQYIMKRIQLRKRKQMLFRAAAILIPLLLFLGQFWYIDKRIDLFADSGYEEIYVPKGERMQLIFQDGSKAMLNAETRIKYPRKFGFNERKVELEGEAFFEVSPNKDRPFIVDLKEVNVKVLGTTFDVKAYATDPDIFVSLETGKVALANNARPLAHLQPGEKATYNRKTGVCKISRPEDIGHNSAWKKNQIVFNNTPLSEVITTLSRWYNVEFEMQDSSLLYYNYTLTSTDQKLEQILKDLEKITPVQFSEKEDVIKIRRKK